MPYSKVRSTWSSGNLVFKDTSGNELMTVDAARSNEYNEIPVSTLFASAESSGSVFLPAPHSGVVSKVAVVPHAAATGTVTFTVLASAVSAGSVAVTSGDASGTVSTVAPAAAVGAIDEDGSIEIRGNGNHTGNIPVTVMALIRR